MLFAADELTLVGEAAKQIPAVAAILFLTVKFLSHLSREARSRDKLDEARHDALEKLGDNCHNFQMDLLQKNSNAFQKVADSIEQNTSVLGRAIEVLNRAVQVIERAEDIIDRNSEPPATHSPIRKR